MHEVNHIKSTDEKYNKAFHNVSPNSNPLPSTDFLLIFQSIFGTCSTFSSSPRVQSEEYVPRQWVRANRIYIPSNMSCEKGRQRTEPM